MRFFWVLFFALMPSALFAQIAGTVHTSATVEVMPKQSAPKKIEEKKQTIAPEDEKSFTPMQQEIARQVQRLNLKNNPMMVQNYYLTMQAMQKAIDKKQAESLEQLKDLLEDALDLGCQWVVTGHYARIRSQNGRYLLLKAADEAKDQSRASFPCSTGT